jgi:hypothetical protein
MWTPGSGGGGGAGGSGDVAGPASSTDNALVRFDSTTGKLLKNGAITETDAGVLNGATQINVDNLRLDGNSVISTDTNGDITIDPDGTGRILLLARGLWGSADAGWGSGGAGVLNGYFSDSVMHQLQFNRYCLVRNDSHYVVGEDSNVAFGYAAAGVGRITQGVGSTMGALRAGREVIARTADLTLTAADTGKLYTNTGAAGTVVLTLPAATLTNNVGPEFFFCVRAAQTLRITAGAGDVINRASAATAAGGNISSNTVRSCIRLTVSAAGFWDALSETGTWA